MSAGCGDTRILQIAGGLTLVVVGFALLTGAWDVFVAWIRDEFVTAVVLLI
ncbi:putative thiol-disulfide oxidoreductase [Rhodococcus wratislaviensis IFP 2016]|nr:putative thiol-disulfide oxidoreductase [Rhodococcus wratislaviensis IFP 2016]